MFGVILDATYWMFLSVPVVGAVICYIRGKKVAGRVLLGLAVLLHVLVILPGIRSARPTARKNLCIAYQNHIESAIKQWGNSNNVARGTPVDVGALAPYLKAGTLPKCLSGGVYRISKVGEAVTCSIPEHLRTTE